jgi:hypothetical protein
VADLPLVCPHGHVPPSLIADDLPLGDPASTLVVPDHYVVRMLYSQGVPMEDLGRDRRDGGPTERDPRAIWRRFCAHFHLFAGTPTGLWLKHELIELFGVEERPSAANADALYDHLSARLADPAYRPRALFERLGIEVLCTTDAATDALDTHHRLQAEGVPVRPTFRPDAAIDPARDDWTSSLGLGWPSGAARRPTTTPASCGRCRPAATPSAPPARPPPTTPPWAPRSRPWTTAPRPPPSRGSGAATATPRSVAASPATCWPRWPA